MGEDEVVSMKDGHFVLGNSVEEMTNMEASSVDLIFTSPPDPTECGMTNNLPRYHKFQRTFCNQFARIISPYGFIVISKTDRKKDGVIWPHHIDYYNILTELGFKLKDQKVVVNTSMNHKDPFRMNYQLCLIFTKDGTFKREGDITQSVLQYDCENISDNTAKYYAWSSQFVELIVGALTKEDERVLDPFAGSAIVLKVAKDMKRRYLGFEIDEKMWEIGQKRL